MPDNTIPHKPLTYEQAKQIAMQWKRAAPLLEAQRERDIRAADTVRDMEVLGGCFDMALRDLPPRESSGLVEMQRWFMLAAARQRGAGGQNKGGQ